MKIFSLNNRGIALVLVILMISIIVAVTLEFNRSSRYEISEAAGLSDDIRLTYMAKSGFYGAQILLLEDMNNFDALTERWAQSEDISSYTEGFFGKDSLQVYIEDESGRIPINKLVNGNIYNAETRDLLVRFLSLPEFKLDQQSIITIVDAIKDWLDTDDDVTGSGAESAYYQSLERSYTCKNKPLDCLEELLMIKGVTHGLYYGTEDTSGLEKYLTVHGEGKININTAPKLVLKALSRDITEDMVNAMDDYRLMEEHDLSDPSWYKKIVGMANVNIPSGLICTRSDLFRIISTGILNNRQKKTIGVVRKILDQKTVKLLYWKVNG
jgi:general secretion pathway protein K